MPQIQTVTSYGNVEGVIKNVLMSNGATQQDPYGRFYIDGQMVNVELSRAIAEGIYLEELFQPGFNCTAEYTDDTRPGGAVRVMLDTLFQPSSRTLSFGGRKGTPGNDGLIDMNGPVMPATDEFLLYLNQVNTQDIVFADLAQAYIPLNIMSSKIAGYGKSVAQDRSASTIAEIIGYCLHRAMNDGNNLINVGDMSADNAYGSLVAKLNAAFTNGDPITGANTFGIEGRIVLCRPEFGYGIFNKQSGVILNGSNLAQEMLRDFNLSAGVNERNYVSQYYIGEFGRLHFLVVPDMLWTYAERYLGLADGDLKGIQALVYSKGSLAVGRVIDLGVKLQDSAPPYPRGIMARPVNAWGHEMFRKGYIVADTDFTLDYLRTTLGLTDATRLYPCAPKDLANNDRPIAVPIFGEDGVSIVGYRQIAKGQYPSGDNWRSGLPQVASVVASVQGGDYTAAQSVTLTTSTPNAEIYYTTDGSEPTLSNGTKYTAAISIAASSTLKARAFLKGYVPSPMTEEVYTITAAAARAAKA